MPAAAGLVVLRLPRHHPSATSQGLAAGALVQMPVLLGMVRLLRQGLQQGRFLRVASLGRPDFLIAVGAGLATALLMLANPDLPEPLRAVEIVLPAIVTFVLAPKFASALGPYRVASNGFTAVRTTAVRLVLRRRIRAGSVSI
jgi:membrane protein insertase Oxa1/YidC/SpoIIIJ